MKKFTFRLEKVLNHKERLFELARAAHGEKVAKLRQEEARLERLQESYRNCLADLAQKTARNFKISELGPFYKFMTFTKRDIAAQNRVVAEAISEEEQARHELMRAAQEKESLVKLKEKKYREYQYESAREEQAFLDDIAAAKFARLKRG